MEHLEMTLRRYLQELLGIPSDIAPDEELMVYGMSSMKLIQLIVRLEHELGIVVNDEDLLLDKWVTVEKICETLTAHASS